MRKRFWIQALVALVAIGLFVGSVGGAFRAGLWRGYQMGQAAESGDEGALPNWGHRWAPRGGAFGYGRGPYMPHARFGGYRPFGLARPLLTLGGLVLLFALFARAFHFRTWRHGWAARGMHRYGPHGHPHGPMPPCGCAGSESAETAPNEEQVAKVKPDAGEAEGES